jgi:butyrate kinase
MHETIILVINIGSTSTKLSVYKNGEAIISEVIRHPREELEVFHDVWEQYDYRKSKITGFLEQIDIPLGHFDVIACRGGTVKPIPGGIYRISPAMLQDMKSKVYGDHPTNLGSLIAFQLAEQLKIPAVTVDPPVTDEMSVLAKYSGIPQIKRRSSFHALSQKSTGRKAAKILGKSYSQLNLIILHLGGGISVGAHQKGRIVDVNNALNGDGPFSPERAGSLPAGDLIDLCFSSGYTREDMHKLICGRGGIMAYLGTTDILEVEERISSGDEKAREVFEAMGYQVAKEVGAAAVVLDGEVDVIAITGQPANSQRLVDIIRKKTAFIAPIYLFPGENEMEALASGALRFIRGEEQAREY